MHTDTDTYYKKQPLPPEGEDSAEDTRVKFQWDLLLDIGYYTL